MSDEKKPQTPAESPTEQSTLEKAIKAVAEQMIPAAVVAAVAATRQGQISQAAASSRPLPPPTAKCTVCRQSLSGCRGEHAKMVVYPQRYPEHGEFFQGAKLNGVRYLSNNESHAITVPANAVAVIANLVKAFEQNEQETRIGRKAERRSGSVGPHGSNFNPAQKAWR